MEKPNRFTGNEVRQLLRRARVGTLATLNRDDGVPYASVVNVATDGPGFPLIMVSGLAWHTRNLLEDGRASLLVAELPTSGDVLTGTRATIMGRMERTEVEAHRQRYLAHTPQAQFYAGFGDFGVWRLVPERIHAVAGFGRIETLDAVAVFPAHSLSADLADSAVQYMNEDHADAVQRLAQSLGGTGDGWRMAAVDHDGADISNGETVLRLGFEAPVLDAQSLRATLARLSRELHS